MNALERRIYPRSDLRWPVSAMTDDGIVQGETKNISMQGAYICSTQPLGPHERCLLTIRGPTGFIHVVAQVVWSTLRFGDDENGPHEMGVNFIWSLPIPQAEFADLSSNN